MSEKEVVGRIERYWVPDPDASIGESILQNQGQYVYFSFGSDGYGNPSDNVVISDSGPGNRIVLSFDQLVDFVGKRLAEKEAKRLTSMPGNKYLEEARRKSW